MYIKDISLLNKNTLENQYIYYKLNNQKMYSSIPLVAGMNIYAIHYKNLIIEMLNYQITNKNELTESLANKNKTISIENARKSFINIYNEKSIIHFKIMKDTNSFVINYIYLEAIEDKYQYKIAIVKKDLNNGKIYCGEFDLIQYKEIREMLLADNFDFSHQLFIDIYLFFKGILHEKPLEYSILSINNILKPLDLLEFDKTDMFSLFVLKFFPFLKIYPKSKVVSEYKPHNLRYELITQIFKPYEREILPKYLLLKENFSYLYDMNLTNEQLEYLLKETKSLKMIKMINPIANKETLKLLNNLYKEDERSNRKIYKYNSYFNLLSVFTNSNNLHRFLSNIEPFNYDENFIRGTNLMDNTIELKEFLQNDLKNFFNSQEKYEHQLIQYIKKYTEKTPVYEDREDFIQCNIEHLHYVLRDIYQSYKGLRKIQERLLKEPIKNKDKLDKMNTIFMIKWNDFDVIHDELADLYLIYEKEEILFESIEKELVEDDNYVLEEVLDSTKLRLIGSKMNICVGSYSNRVSSKQCSIFIIREKNGKDNYNFKMCIEYDINANFIVQSKGNRNSLVTDEKIIELLEKFVEKNNIEGYKY